MSLFAKIMVVVNLILAVVFLAAAGTFLNATQSWKAQHGSAVALHATEKSDLQSQVAGHISSKESAVNAANAAEAAKQGAESKLSVLQNSNEALHAHNQKLEESLKTLATTQQDLQTKNSELQSLVENLRNEVARVEGEKAALRFAVFQINQFEENPDGFKRLEPLSPPDGSPIGTDLNFEY